MLDDALKDQKKSANQQYAKIGKALAVIAAVVVLAVVGKTFISSPAPEDIVNSEPVPSVAGTTNVDNEQARDEFKRALADFDQSYTDAMASQALARWAPDELQQTKDVYDKAVSAFAGSRYVDALQAIETAHKDAQDLVNRWEEAFQESFRQAQDAFENNESRKADLHLTQALKLKPDNTDALALKQRLSKLPDIEQLLEDVRIAQTENSLEREAEAIRKIIELDPARTEMAQRLAVVNEALKKAEYQRHISQGMSALNNGQLSQAQNALTKAKRLYPNNKEVQVLETEIAAKSASNQRQIWRDQIKDLVNQDDWQNVLAISERAKKAFPTDKQFVDSSALANDILSRSQRIDRYLAQPDRLKDSGIHANATAFAEASQEVAQNSLGLILKLEQFNAVAGDFRGTRSCFS